MQLLQIMTTLRSSYNSGVFSPPRAKREGTGSATEAGVDLEGQDKRVFDLRTSAP